MAESMAIIHVTTPPLSNKSDQKPPSSSACAGLSNAASGATSGMTAGAISASTFGAASVTASVATSGAAPTGSWLKPATG